MLRFIHGEYYSASRLHRFGLINTPFCNRCQALETVNHRLMECRPIRELWGELIDLSHNLDIVRNPQNDLLRNVTGAINVPSIPLLTLNCELLTNIMRRYFEPPHNAAEYVKLITRSLIRKEQNEKTKRALSLII